MKIIITEEQKKKLFIPRGLSNDENNRYLKLNQEQPIKDGIRINQYDYKGNKQGYWESYYGNGQLKYKGLYINGLEHGIWEWYHSNGQIGFKGSYNNGKRDGIWEEYWSNGKLWYKGSYKNGEKGGLWEWYYTNGQLWKKGLYKNDELVKKLPLTESEQPKKGKLFIPRRLSGENSRFIQWNKEQPIVDNVQINQYTHDGKPIGYWDNWVDDDDIMVGKGTFVKGKKEGYWEEYLDGELVGKGSYKNGKESGIWEFYEDGEVYRKELFQSGKLVGSWYPSKDTLDESEQSKKGKLFIPRRLSGENSRFIQWNKEQPIVDGVQINQYTHDGKKEGYWESYYGNGNLYSKGSYKNDKKDGIWEEWFYDGKLKSKGSYINGEMDGIWEKYYYNGQLESKGSYKNDKKDGIWEEWFKDGDFWYEGEWDMGKYIRDIRI